MNRLDLEDWPTELPPTGFAERTVASMLAIEPRPRRLASPRRLWLLVALVSVFCGATAWGMFELGRPRTVGTIRSQLGKLPASAAPVASEAAPFAVTPTAAPMRRSPPPRPRAVPLVPARPSASVAAEPAPSAPPREFHTPPCECTSNGGLCTCWE